MPSHVQVYTPIANQRVHRDRLNVMGRTLSPKVTAIQVFLDNFLIRRIKPSQTGAFECRMDLSEAALGEHAVEIRANLGHHTERVLVRFFKTEPPEAP